MRLLHILRNVSPTSLCCEREKVETEEAEELSAASRKHTPPPAARKKVSVSTSTKALFKVTAHAAQVLTRRWRAVGDWRGEPRKN